MRCIYCARPDSEVIFNREHILPQNIGGKLYFDNLVCKFCNSFLGSNVDNEILKLPETLDAFKHLEIPHDRPKILNRYFKIRGFLGRLRLKAKAKNDGFQIIDQELLDGSKLTSNENLEERLKTIIHRDKRLNEAGLTSDEINKEIKKILKSYHKLIPGEDLLWSKLGVRLVNREEKIRFEIEKNDNVNIDRLISKIAFEFFFFTSYHTFASNIQFLEPLYKQIITGCQQSELSISKLQTQSTEYKPYHAISLELFEGHTRVVVVFFGKIIYSLIGPALADSTFTEISNKLEIDKITGVLYEQDLKPTRKKFGLFMKDGSNIGVINL